MGKLLKKSIIFMSQNLNSNNVENNESNLKAEDSDYKDLMTKL